MEKEEKPLQHIERSPIFLTISVLISSTIVFIGYNMLKNMNPWGFIVLIPGSIFSFQTLWWLLHPFAIVFEDKIEIKQSLLHHKYRYFVDLKRISESKKGKIYITYNDDEMEGLNLFGIKPSHVSFLKSEMERSVSQNMKLRP
ncbi:hypothetical protein [Aurantibacillus circumpalustris]|uniref:hypothetical protein n=1 Tax=Aurantibacillus circumpalustris TaxID=3036359 RepID=UPI00295B3C9A|nr:hypothetical protein [Aurantibacillus circumpalustris]